MRQNLLLIFCILGLLVSAEEKKIALLQPRVAEGSDSCKTIEINTNPETRIEIDGEAVGTSPFRFELVPKSIRVVVGHSYVIPGEKV